MEKFKSLILCLVINRLTGEELVEYLVKDRSECSARHRARDIFEWEQKYQPNLRKCSDWYIDSCIVD
jgi:hypothetical protein